eukprot:g5086.t1
MGDETPYVRERQTFDGRAVRGRIQRKYVDYRVIYQNALYALVYERDFRDRMRLQPHSSYTMLQRSPAFDRDIPCMGYATRLCRTVANKGSRSPIYCATWLPEIRQEGRYLITGSCAGEFTLWNGLMFKFETILQAHDTAVRDMAWTQNGDYMVTADHGGCVKYWEQSLNCCAKPIQASKDPIRSVSLCPTDVKFSTGADDSLVKIWDFQTQKCEKELKGHGWDVKAVAWHPSKALIASGGKDNLMKFWDPKAGECISTVHDHKNTVMRLEWNKNANWLLTCSRDEKIRLYDIRKINQKGKGVPVYTYEGHGKEVTAITWHPFHERSFASGDFNGTLNYWSVHRESPVETVEAAHDSGIWALSWHPGGHVLASGSNDHSTRFWSRVRPGCSTTQQLNIWDENQNVGGNSNSNNDKNNGQSRAQTSNFKSGAFGLADTKSVIPGMNGETTGVDMSSSLNQEKRQTTFPPPPDTYTCNMCGVKGHWIQQCPQRGGGSSNAPPANYVCNKCGIPGHYIKDCPMENTPPEGYVCHFCHIPGHFRKDCPMDKANNIEGVPSKPRNTDASGHRPPPDNYTCRICGIKGHWIQQCPQRGGQGQSNNGSQTGSSSNTMPLGVRKAPPGGGGMDMMQPPTKMRRYDGPPPPNNRFDAPPPPNFGPPPPGMMPPNFPPGMMPPGPPPPGMMPPVRPPIGNMYPQHLPPQPPQQPQRRY